MNIKTLQKLAGEIREAIEQESYDDLLARYDCADEWEFIERVILPNLE